MSPRLAGAPLVGVLALMAVVACTQNATARARERALDDAGFRFASTQWCLEDVVGSGVSEADGLSEAIQCFEGDISGFAPEDIPPMGRGSYVLSLTSGADGTEVTAISASFAMDNSGGGSGTDSVAACWAVTIDWADASLQALRGVQCDAAVLAHTNGRASDEGLRAIRARAPERDNAGE